MKDLKQYTKATIELIKLSLQDIIITSNEEVTENENNKSEGGAA